MGGVLILFAMTVSTLLWTDLRSGLVWLLIGISLFFGLHRFGSTTSKRSIRGTSRGCERPGKTGAPDDRGRGGWGVSATCTRGHDGHLSFPFFKTFRPDLGWWYMPFAVLVIVGASNAVNLTDGLDGLAAGPMVITGSTYLIFSYIAGNAIVASYLQIPFVPGGR